MSKKLSQEEFEARVKEKLPTIEILSEYKGRREKVLRKCTVCGDVRWVLAGSLFAKNAGCAFCAIEKSAKAKVKTTEQYKKELAEKQPYIELISEYAGTDNKVRLRCKIDGTEWENTAYSALHNTYPCPECFKKNRNIRTDEDFKKDLQNKFPKIQSLSKFERTDKPVLFKCSVCGYEWEAKPNRVLNVYKGESGCPRCEGKHYNITEDDFAKRVEKGSPNTEYVSGFKTVNGKATFRCKICGYEWKTICWEVEKGTGCPKCKMSKGEIRVSKYFDSRNIKYIPQYQFKDCKYKYSLRFDFYLPELNVACEYNGIQHYKFTNFGDKRNRGESLATIQARDRTKEEYCKNNNIRLITIPYTEFDKIEEILDNYLFPKQDGNASLESGAKWEILRCAARSIHMKITTIMQSVYTFS